MKDADNDRALHGIKAEIDKAIREGDEDEILVCAALHMGYLWMMEAREKKQNAEV